MNAFKQRAAHYTIGTVLLLVSQNISADEAANRAALASAASWVETHQNLDGSWGADENIRYLTTSNTVDALRAANRYKVAYYAGIAWLENHKASNIDFVSRKIVTLSRHGNNLNDDLSRLQSEKTDASQNGWGLSKNYQSSTLDTALALKALLVSGDTTGQTGAIDFLASNQLTDGGWSLANATTADPWITGYVHTVLASVPSPTTAVTAMLGNSETFLNTIPDTSESLVLAQTAFALFKTQGLSTRVDQLITALLSRQTASGNWEDTYTTSVAMRMLAGVLGMDADSFHQSADIADQTLRSIINNQLGNNAFDSIVQGELLEITSLDLRNTDVQTLAGLSGATNLTTVQVNANTDTSALTGVTIIVDSDSDDIVDANDNCPLTANPGQENLDGDAFGDACDDDIDGDHYTVAHGDWNDYDNTLYPGAPEICGDGIDQNGDNVDKPCMDSDNDGLPDNWELAHGLDPNNPADAAIDSDGDGFTALQEYAADGTPEGIAATGLSYVLYNDDHNDNQYDDRWYVVYATPQASYTMDEAGEQFSINLQQPGSDCNILKVATLARINIDNGVLFGMANINSGGRLRIGLQQDEYLTNRVEIELDRNQTQARLQSWSNNTLNEQTITLAADTLDSPVGLRLIKSGTDYRLYLNKVDVATISNANLSDNNLRLYYEIESCTGDLAATDVNIENIKVLLDTDADGLADLKEDANTNGTLDTGETNPLVADDTDADGLLDGFDNCTQAANPNQIDTDGDGFGNYCDPDYNNDGSINFIDLGIMKSVFFSNDANIDMNGDGSVNFIDLGIMKSMFFGSPGPSGLIP